MDLPTSNAMSADSFAFHWRYQEPPVINVCATTGAGFLRRLYDTLGVPWMSAWGGELQAALVAKAQLFQSTAPSNERAAWTSIVRALQADLANSRTSELGHLFGVYVTYYQPNNRRFDALSFPPGTVLLPWGASPDGTNAGDIVCIDPAQDTAFLFTGTPAAVAQARAQAERESVTGIRMGEGRPVPPDQRTLPNDGVIGLAGLLGLAAVGIGAWWLLKPSRANPNLSRAKIDGLRTCWQRCEVDAGIHPRDVKSE